MTDIYHGKIVPEPINQGGPMNCDNSYCVNIHCTECINYPSGDIAILKHDYLYEAKHGTNIYSGATRILYD